MTDGQQLTERDDQAEGRATVLLVDDSSTNQLIIAGMLRHDFRVIAANTGEAALVLVHAQPRPDLILLDIMMEGMDGFEVLRRLKADSNTADIPVIFVTGVHDAETERQGFELGASDYLHKPIQAPVVKARIRAQLDAKAARDILRKNNLRLVNKVEEGIHALEKAQMQLMQSDKMAAVGQLAAGVAHEINNPIGFIGSNLYSLSAYLKDIFAVINAYGDIERNTPVPGLFDAVADLREQLRFEEIREDVFQLLAESNDGIERVKKIVQDLKDFSRTADNAWHWSDIHHGLDSTLNIVWNDLKYHCTVHKHYSDLPLINCLPSQLNQVFMNLLVNAGHSISGRGDITLTTERVGEDQIKIHIADTGCGIPAENLSKIFDPFFTTKPIGKGTGLGLALAWTIIQRHHGRLEVFSTPGQGTEFVITLPIDPSRGAENEAEARLTDASPAPAASQQA